MNKVNEKNESEQSNDDLWSSEDSNVDVQEDRDMDEAKQKIMGAKIKKKDKKVN